MQNWQRVESIAQVPEGPPPFCEEERIRARCVYMVRVVYREQVVEEFLAEPWSPFRAIDNRKRPSRLQPFSQSPLQQRQEKSTSLFISRGKHMRCHIPTNAKHVSAYGPTEAHACSKKPDTTCFLAAAWQAHAPTRNLAPRSFPCEALRHMMPSMSVLVKHPNRANLKGKIALLSCTCCTSKRVLAGTPRLALRWLPKSKDA